MDFNDQKEIRLVYQCKEIKEKQEKIYKKYKTKRGRGFGDGFKSLGKQWRNSMQWGKKKSYAMVNVPKRVTLPNGRTFVARYKRIRRG